MKHAPLRCRRYLAVWLFLLSTDRVSRIERQAGHAPDNRPLVVVARRAHALRLTGADRHARALGLLPGLAFTDAKLRVPDMRVVEHDQAADAELLEAIAEWCDRYSPVVASVAPDMIVLDITGVAHLFGGEAGLLADVRDRFARQGFALRAAIAGTVRAARAHCRFGTQGIVPMGEEAQRALTLPVEALECANDTLVALRRAGLKVLGDLAARPRAPLAARFGGEASEALAQILGETDRPLIPRRPLPFLMAEQRFAEPIGLMEDISAALDPLTENLCRQLERAGRGGRGFEIAFYRADGRIERVALMCGQPLREPRTLKRLLEMRIDALADPLDPGFGFDMIRLGVLAADALVPVQSGLDGKIEARQAVAELVDRLSARFGTGSVQRFVAHDTHLPERASRAVPAVSDAAGQGGWAAGQEAEGLGRPLFSFHPPQRIEVVAEVPDGPPRRFLWRKAWFDVAKAEGPERIAPEWWRAGRDRRLRDYFRVEDTDGHRFWVFRYGDYGDGPEPVVWYVQGLFP